MSIKEEHRLKVEKGLEREAMMLGLRLRYLGIYAVFFLLSISPLLTGVTFETGVLSLVLAAMFYMLIKYADEQDFLEKKSSQSLPKYLINDLYKRLKRGSN